MTAWFLKSGSIEELIIDRARDEERLVALAFAMGAKSLDLEWDEAFNRKYRYSLTLTGRLRRKAYKLAIANLEATHEGDNL